MSLRSEQIECELVNNLLVFNHITELLERDLPVKVFISLNYSPVDQLLNLDISQILADHDLQSFEQFSVRNESIVIYIVNLKCESQLLFV